MSIQNMDITTWNDAKKMWRKVQSWGQNPSFFLLHIHSHRTTKEGEKQEQIRNYKKKYFPTKKMVVKIEYEDVKQF